MSMKKEVLALSTLVGTIVGVGIFGLPYAFVRSGFLVGIGYLVILGCAMLILHLLYGEIILRTEKNMRFFGYARWYLGKWSEIPTGVSSTIGLFGALLAYILVGGQFLKTIGGSWYQGSDRFYIFLFWALFSAVVLFGLRAVTRAEFWMSVGLVVLVIVIFIAAAPSITTDNLFASVGERNIFFPYGLVLFALSGAMVIPEIREVLRGKEDSIKKIIIAGTLIPAVLYGIFTLAVVGVSGAKTSTEAIKGLSDALGSSMMQVGAWFGLLAVATSFIATSIYVRDLLRFDLQVHKMVAVAVAVVSPLLLLMAGVDNYLSILGFIGAVAGGTDAILLILMYRKARLVGQRVPEYTVRVPRFILRLLLLCFSLGIVYEIYIQVIT
jgi:tyrosine-specific transport protein